MQMFSKHSISYDSELCELLGSTWGHMVFIDNLDRPTLMRQPRHGYVRESRFSGKTGVYSPIF